MRNTTLRIFALASLTLAICLHAACLDNNHSAGAKAASGIDKKKTKKDKTEKEPNTIAANCVGGELVAKQAWDLPKELLEISGITWISSERFAAVEDNMGNIFIYNLKTNKIEKKLAFGPKGDYEGIARVGDNYFVIRSDGQLYEVAATGKILKQYKLPLTATDNIETLHYDAANVRLILGQKDGAKNAAHKNFYSFDLRQRRFNPSPIFSLDLNDPIVSCEDGNSVSKQKKKGKKKGGGAVIRPSELAIHPSTKEIYIADGPNQRILVLSPDGKPKHYLLVDKKDFPQVEGLMFSAQGELYISTEGTKNPARIARMDLISR